MAVGNSQMGLESKGIRGGIVKLNNSKEVTADRIVETFLYLRDQLKNINSWSAFAESCVAQDLYGFTKHTDLWIIACLFKNGLNLRDTSDMIGYLRKNPKQPTHALSFRLKRMNILNLFATIEAFVEKDLITIETIREILRIDGHFNQKQTASRNGKVFKYYAKWYVSSAIECRMKRQNVTDDVAIAWLADKLSLDINTIVHWYNLEVEDIMVKPTVATEE
jgi:hypothetical protein